jgi:hypothetical protein
MTKAKPSTRIVNRGRGHSYLLDGEKAPGVTTVLDKGVPKPALIDWAARQAADYAINHWDELTGLQLSERHEAIRGARWTTLKAAGERGREVHTLGHRYLAGEDVTPPEELAGFLDAYVRFVDEWRLEEQAIEVAVFHRADPDAGRPFAYGGRFDLLGRLADQALWLLDFKTSLRGVFMEYALQLAAYRYADFYVLDGEVDEDGAAIEHPMPRIDRAGVVHLRADGSYDLVPLEAGYDALEVFTAAQQVAAFATSDRDEWIGDALRPPEPAHEPPAEELELEAERQEYLEHQAARDAAA